MKPVLNRKEFLALSTLGGLSLATRGAAAPKPRTPPDGILRHACIGVVGIGTQDIAQLSKHPKLRIVALCDVDSNHLAAAAQKVPNAKLYADWREMFEREGDRIDSCNISVPDHMHAIITLAAIRAGIHVYCQKPLAHDVAECRAMTVAARRAGIVSQLGTQHASGPGDRLAVHLLREGVLGKVRRVILCSNRATGMQFRLEGPRPAETEAPPASLNWDLWLGTAPVRPYAPAIYHPKKWRSWQDFGTGWSGDIGCHIFDAVWKGLDLSPPKSVIAEVQPSWRESAARRTDTWPQSNHLTWIFPGNAKTEKRELTVEWFDGDIYPPEEAQAISTGLGFAKYPEEAALVIGTEGSMLLPHRGGPRIFPLEKFADLKKPDLSGPDHHARFVDACLGGAPTESNFDQTGPMSEAIILGTVAIRHPGQRLDWDARNLRIPNFPAAEKLLRRSYRKGWDVDLRA